MSEPSVRIDAKWNVSMYIPHTLPNGMSETMSEFSVGWGSFKKRNLLKTVFHQKNTYNYDSPLPTITFFFSPSITT